MERNQTAREIAAEYELMAIDAANQLFRLRQQRPFMEFPGLSKHRDFCTLMHKYWQSITEKLDTGPEMYESDSDGYPSEWGMM